MSEEWRVIEATPNYAVSSLGRVKRIAPGPGTAVGHIKKSSAVQGYRVVMLVHAGKRTLWRVHRLVCIAFHGPQPTPKHEVAHRNGRRDDNSKDNLRWATSAENTADNYANGTIFYGTDHWNGKLSDDDVRAIRVSCDRVKDAAIAFGVTPSCISEIRSGKQRALVQ